MAGLRSDHDAGAARRDHTAKLFEHNCCAVKVDREYGLRRGLRWRDAGSVYDAEHIAKVCRRLYKRLQRSTE